eukprot:CAMPEP_0171454936 /NCGR_PEP_ID=MMETSP0945-20130129/2029_1 /TAXON_ID=109269 /ORGANISM="Vaucheria litorea, Strain CCMP2940" /LENGTH=388 /DNA_ID=CAMNT_0011980071 /DNA_START=8 /DNA_END=1174 /DNA_ORIENTATION=-
MTQSRRTYFQKSSISSRSSSPVEDTFTEETTAESSRASLDSYDKESYPCDGTRDDKSKDDKLAASRERNRIHAQKTRERKKNRLINLQHKRDALRNVQNNLKEKLDARITAKLLLCLNGSKLCTDMTDYPSLNIIEDSNNSSKLNSNSEDMNDCSMDELPSYLSVSLSNLTPEEREQVRRERNRVHAKRTRNRKKRVLLELEKEICIIEKNIYKLGIMCKQQGIEVSETEYVYVNGKSHQNCQKNQSGVCRRVKEPPFLFLHSTDPIQSFPRVVSPMHKLSEQPAPMAKHHQIIGVPHSVVYSAPMHHYFDSQPYNYPSNQQGVQFKSCIVPTNVFPIQYHSQNHLKESFRPQYYGLQHRYYENAGPRLGNVSMINNNNYSADIHGTR